MGKRCMVVVLCVLVAARGQRKCHLHQGTVQYGICLRLLNDAAMHPVKEPAFGLCHSNRQRNDGLSALYNSSLQENALLSNTLFPCGGLGTSRI